VTRSAGLIALGAVATALAACGGGDDEPVSACKLVKPADVRAAVGGGGKLSRHADETPGLSVCSDERPGVSVRVSVDTATIAPRRYFNRITEQYEFHAGDPENAPQLITGIGDDKRALGGAGAYWVPANHQLLATAGDRTVIVTLYVRGRGEVSTRRAAARLAKLALGASGAQSSAPAAPASLSVISPAPRAFVRDPRLPVAGVVSPTTARVTINGRAAAVRGGIFRVPVALRPGVNRIEVRARAGKRDVGSTTLSITRGPPAAVAVRRLVASYHGRIPDLVGERLDVALPVLDRLRIAHRLVKISEGKVSRTAWAACGLRPIAGRKVPAKGRVLVLTAPVDVGRSSGTSCRNP
jgi:glucodextranase-like protein